VTAVSCAPSRHETPGERARSASPTGGEPARSILRARPRRPRPATTYPTITAGVCAFSPTSHITQRDDGIGMRHAGPPHPPAPRRPRPHRTAPPRRPEARSPLYDPALAPVPGPGSPGVSMHLAGIPAIREPILEPLAASGRPGQGSRSSPAPFATSFAARASGTTDGDASTTAIRKTRSAADECLLRI
jgi:hypothetical protein